MSASDLDGKLRRLIDLPQERVTRISQRALSRRRPGAWTRPRVVAAALAAAAVIVGVSLRPGSAPVITEEELRAPAVPHRVIIIHHTSRAERGQLFVSYGGQP